MDKWEYKLVDAVSWPVLAALLNEYGQEGWEAVAPLGEHVQILVKRRLP